MLALASGAQERYLARWIGRTLPVLFERAKDGAARATPPITSLSRCGQNPTYITKSSPCGSCPPRVENAKENCCHEQDNPLLSVVVPVYNEQEVIAETAKRLRGVLDGMSVDYEIVFVNDGSRDGTLSVLRPLCEADARPEARQLFRATSATRSPSPPAWT